MSLYHMSSREWTPGNLDTPSLLGVILTMPEHGQLQSHKMLHRKTPFKVLAMSDRCSVHSHRRTALSASLYPCVPLSSASPDWSHTSLSFVLRSCTC